MIHRTTAITPLVLLLLSGWDGRTLAAEGVTLYRCDVNGTVEFRQTACETGSGTRVHVINRSSGLTPVEPGLRLKNASEKTDTVSRREVREASARQCWEKRQQLQRVESRLRAGYRASQYQPLHDRQREYEDFIRRFCRH